MANSNYTLIYPDESAAEDDPSKGYVEIHTTHNSHEAQKNIETAILLAKLGFQVRLLPIDDTEGSKNPDAYLMKENIRIEFKHNQKPTASAIDNELRDARRQADYVLIHVQSKIKKGDLFHGVQNRMKAAQNIKELWLIWKEKLIRLKRKEIFDGTLSRKIQ